MQKDKFFENFMSKNSCLCGMSTIKTKYFYFKVKTKIKPFPTLSGLELN